MFGKIELASVECKFFDMETKGNVAVKIVQIVVLTNESYKPLSMLSCLRFIMDHKFKWPKEGVNYRLLTYNIVT